MPNNVKNKLVIKGTNEQIKAIFEKYNTHVAANISNSYDGDIICMDNSKSDFTVGWFNPHTGIFKTREKNSERIGLPRNCIFKIEKEINAFPDFDKIIPHPRCDEYNDIPSQQEVSGHENWWSTWNCKNWGTKWNGYRYESEDYGVFLFETAWNGVPLLMLELSKQNQDIEFEYTYADEDSGYNVGKFTFKNGEVISAFKPNGGTKEAYDLYFDTRPYCKSDYELIEGNYTYK